MKKDKTRRVKMTKGERMIYVLGSMCLVGVLIVKIFCGASISNLQLNIEKINYEINNENKKIESLSMKVSELTSFENVKGVVKDMGLSYNNENIVVVNE